MASDYGTITLKLDPETCALLENLLVNLETANHLLEQQEPCCRKRPLTPEDIEIINSTFAAALNVHSRPNRPPLPG